MISPIPLSKREEGVSERKSKRVNESEEGRRREREKAGLGSLNGGSGGNNELRQIMRIFDRGTLHSPSPTRPCAQNEVQYLFCGQLDGARACSSHVG